MHGYGTGLIGGILIGLSAVLLMLTLGRIAGVSGIVGNLLPPRPAADRAWRIAFLLGLVAAPLSVQLATGQIAVGAPVAGWPVLVVAGFLVGSGTALGGGCTSGHGICGLARLSARSLAAVATFMAVGIVTVLVVRHIAG